MVNLEISGVDREWPTMVRCPNTLKMVPIELINTLVIEIEACNVELESLEIGSRPMVAKASEISQIWRYRSLTKTLTYE